MNSKPLENIKEKAANGGEETETTTKTTEVTAIIIIVILLTLGEGSLQFHMMCTAFSNSSRIFSLSFGLNKIQVFLIEAVPK